MYQDYNIDMDEKSVWLFSHAGVIQTQLPFQIHEAGCFLAGLKYYTIRESKEDYLLLYTISGLGLLEYDGAIYSLPKGSIALIDCRKRHSYRTHPQSKSQKWQFYWIHFSGQSCAFYYNTLFKNAYQVIHCDEEYLLSNQFKQILRNYEKTRMDICFRMSDYVSGILLELIDLRFSQRQACESHQKVLKKATEFIRENYSSFITVDEIAAYVSISKYYFIKLFKRYMQVTPYEFLICYRLFKAKKLLCESYLSVNEISGLVGFNDDGHFTRTFKRHVGMTPLNYRKNLGGHCQI